MADELIEACRRWAGMPLDEFCRVCRTPFYNANALPVCYGCRRDHAREQLLLLLQMRADDLIGEPSFHGEHVD